MDPDIALVIGLVLAAFSVPSMVSALSDGRAPRASAITVLIAGGLLLLAIQTKPGGYTFASVRDAFARVMAMIIP